MSDPLENIAAQLRHYTLGEIIALVCDFVGELDQEQQLRFRDLVAQGPRPLVAEAMGLDDIEDLLDEIQFLRDAIANDVYVEYGAGYDAEYGEYRGFGDDSWIDEMDALFGVATSLFRAGQFKAAADAYIALFGIFDLCRAEDMGMTMDYLARDAVNYITDFKLSIVFGYLGVEDNL